MWTLGIDSATLQGSVALLKDDRCLEERVFEQGMIHGRELIPAIGELCDRHSLRMGDLDLVACDIGPGSYTGLRVGIATAKGLCRFSGAAIIGVCSLDAMAEAYRLQHGNPSPSPVLCPALDAKWRQLYTATYTIDSGRIRRTSEPRADRPDAIPRRDPAPIIFGDAVLSFREVLEASGAILDPDPSLLHPRAAKVARLGALDYTSGRHDTVMGLEPLYLRPTEAELKLRKTD
jgi:tRNA threonylcarbamoyladenosine biosynthesis protein TsaB